MWLRMIWKKPVFRRRASCIPLATNDLSSDPVWHYACFLLTCLRYSEKTVHFVTMAHQLAWMEHPAIWLCASCAILWLVLRVVRTPLVRTGVLLMLCGLGMNTANKYLWAEPANANS
jgi:hypothetical protein